jgi:hypothetical protein
MVYPEVMCKTVMGETLSSVSQGRTYKNLSNEFLDYPKMVGL